MDFTASALLVKWQEGHLACIKKLAVAIARGSTLRSGPNHNELCKSRQVKQIL